MAKTWEQIQADPAFAQMNPNDQAELKRDFFNKRVATTPEYKKLGHQGRQAMQAQFMGTQAAPNYNVLNATGEGLQTGFDQTLTGALVNKGLGRGVDQQNPLITHAAPVAPSNIPLIGGLVDMGRQSYQDVADNLEGLGQNFANGRGGEGFLEGAAGGLAAGAAAFADPIGLGIDAVTAGQGGKLANQAVGKLARVAPGVAARAVPAIPHVLGAASGVVQGGAFSALQGDTQGVPANALIGAVLTGAMGLHPHSPLASNLNRPAAAGTVPPAAAAAGPTPAPAPHPYAGFAQAHAAPAEPHPYSQFGQAHAAPQNPQGFGQAQGQAYAKSQQPDPAAAPQAPEPMAPTQPTTAANQQWTLNGKPVAFKGYERGFMIVDDGVTRHQIQPGDPSLVPDGGFQTVSRPGAQATAESLSRDGRERGQGTDRTGERPEGYNPNVEPTQAPRAPREPGPSLRERADNFLVDQATKGPWNIPQTPKALNPGAPAPLGLPAGGRDEGKAVSSLKNAEDHLRELEDMAVTHGHDPDVMARVDELTRQQHELIAGLRQTLTELRNPTPGRTVKGDVLERNPDARTARVSDRALEGQHGQVQRALPPGDGTIYAGPGPDKNKTALEGQHGQRPQAPTAPKVPARPESYGGGRELPALPPAPERGRGDGNPVKTVNHGPIPMGANPNDPTHAALYGEHKPNRFSALEDKRAPHPKAESPAPSNAGPVEEAPSPSRFRQAFDGVAGSLRDGTPAPNVRQLGAGHPAIQPPPAKPKAAKPARDPDDDWAEHYDGSPRRNPGTGQRLTVRQAREYDERTAAAAREAEEPLSADEQREARLTSAGDTLGELEREREHSGSSEHLDGAIERVKGELEGNRKPVDPRLDDDARRRNMRGHAATIRRDVAESESKYPWTKGGALHTSLLKQADDLEAQANAAELEPVSEDTKKHVARDEAHQAKLDKEHEEHAKKLTEIQHNATKNRLPGWVRRRLVRAAELRRDLNIAGVHASRGRERDVQGWQKRFVESKRTIGAELDKVERYKEALPSEYRMDHQGWKNLTDEKYPQALELDHELDALLKAIDKTESVTRKGQLSRKFDAKQEELKALLADPGPGRSQPPKHKPAVKLTPEQQLQVDAGMATPEDFGAPDGVNRDRIKLVDPVPPKADTDAITSAALYLEAKNMKRRGEELGDYADDLAWGEANPRELEMGLALIDRDRLRTMRKSGKDHERELDKAAQRLEAARKALENPDATPAAVEADAPATKKAPNGRDYEDMMDQASSEILAGAYEPGYGRLLANGYEDENGRIGAGFARHEWLPGEFGFHTKTAEGITKAASGETNMAGHVDAERLAEKMAGWFKRSQELAPEKLSTTEYAFRKLRRLANDTTQPELHNEYALAAAEVKRILDGDKEANAYKFASTVRAAMLEHAEFVDQAIADGKQVAKHIAQGARAAKKKLAEPAEQAPKQPAKAKAKGKIEQEGTTDGADEIRTDAPGSPDEARPGKGDGAEGERPARDAARESGDDGAGRPDDHGGSGDAVPGSVGASEPVTVSPRAKRHVEPEGPRNTGNYRMPDDFQVVRAGEGDVAKYNNNVAAIKLLRELEDSGRRATPEEQDTLARYVGWGGLPGAFDHYKAPYGQNDGKWYNRAQELKDLLSKDEHEAAQRSTVNAHYTAKEVVSAMWKAVEGLGFAGGKVLEPSMGSGNFYGWMPEHLSKASRLAGVELDSITGRIAKQLYPDAAIRVEGYQDFAAQPGTYDLIISNVPFLKTGPHDKVHNPGGKLSLHDYFFNKSLALVRPGGLVAFITSTGSMDTPGIARKLFAEKADLVAAVRLPNDAFKKNAGTQVTTDLIILRKRLADEGPAGPEWTATKPVSITDDRGVLTGELNTYYHKNPSMLLGENARSTLYGGNGLGLKSHEGMTPEKMAKEIQARIIKAAKAYEAKTGRKPFDREPHKATTVAEREPATVAPAAAHHRDGSIVLTDAGELRMNQDGSLVPVKLPGGIKNVHEKAKALVGIRDLTRDLIHSMKADEPDSTINYQRAELNKAYDKFVKDHGYISAKRVGSALADDPDYPLLLSLEKWDGEKKVAKKADIFTKRTIQKRELPTRASSALDALSISSAEPGSRGRLNMQRMSELTGKSVSDLVDELGDRVYENPAGEQWETRDEYLSGNVREKLRVAETAAAMEPRYKRNVEVLKAVQPDDIPLEKINVRLGASWLDENIVREFLAEKLRVNPADVGRIDKVVATGSWHLEPGFRAEGAYANKGDLGTNRKTFLELVDDIMNFKDTRVMDGSKKNGDLTLNVKETEVARARKEEIKKLFRDWLSEDPKRAERVTKQYNSEFNAHRLRSYDGSHLNFPGQAAHISLRSYQANAVWRIVQDRRALLAHTVGAGKTFTMATAAMELKRLGLADKPLFVVPNHLSEQWPREFLQLYPGANILALTGKDFETKNRQKMLSKIATGNWDAVFVAHSQLGLLPNNPEEMRSIIREELEALEEAHAQAIAAGADEKSRSVKDLVKRKIAKEEKLKKMADLRKDGMMAFEDLGVDFMFVDEAHNYKNLFYSTKMNNVAGLGPQRGGPVTLDFYAKVRHIQKIQQGRGVVLATGTPVTNSLSELYTLHRYLTPDVLAERGISNFDAWASNFGDTKVVLQQTPGGKLKQKTRFSRLVNIPEMLSMFRGVADVVTSPMLGTHVDRPTIKSEDGKVATVVAQPSPELLAFTEQLNHRANNLKRGDKDNMLSITTAGRTASLSMRLIDDSLPDDPGNKINLCVGKVLDVYKRTTGVKLIDGDQTITANGTQMVFCDTRTPSGDKAKAKAAKAAELAEDEGPAAADGSDEIMSAEDLEDEYAATSSYSPYEDIKAKLIAGGIPAHEIAFIHDIGPDKTGVKKAELMERMRQGQLRVLIGSTKRMGEGTNAQRLMAGLHHLDFTWTPAGMEQRGGRIIRQGNLFKEVEVYGYVTERSFDAPMLSQLSDKQGVVDRIMAGDDTVRELDDLDSASELDSASMAAIASGNPLLKEEADNDVALMRLTAEEGSHRKKIGNARAELASLPEKMERNRESKKAAEADLARFKKGAELELGGRTFLERKDAGEVLLAEARSIKPGAEKRVGSFGDFSLTLQGHEEGNLMNEAGEHVGRIAGTYVLEGDMAWYGNLGPDAAGNVTRLENLGKNIERYLGNVKESWDKMKADQAHIEGIVNQPFTKAAELTKLQERQRWVKEQLVKLADVGKELAEGEDGFLDIGGTLKAFADWVNARKKAKLQNGQNAVDVRPASPLALTSEVSLAGKLPKIQRRLKKLEAFHAAAAAAGNDELMAVAQSEIAHYRSVLDAEYQHAHASRTKAADLAGDLPESGRAYDGEKFAGNINLNRIASSDDVKALLQDVADHYAPQIEHARRGKISHAETEELAAQVGMTAKKLLARKRGEAMNAEQATAARQVLAASSDNLKKLADGVAAGKNSDDELLAFTRAVELHAEIQAQVSGIAAEAGRTLSAFNIQAKAEAKRLAEVRNLLESLGGRDRLSELAGSMAALDALQLNKAARDFRKLTAWDYASELFVNSILSGPPTHIANAIGNTTSIAGKVLETHAAAVMGFGKGPVTHAEARAQFSAIAEGVRAGSGLFWHALKTEQPKSGLSQVDVHRRAFKGKLGYAVRFSGTALMASDEFFKSIFYRMELAGQAHRMATKEGLTGKGHAERVAELLEDVPHELHTKAAASADEYTFTNRLTDNDPLSAAGRALAVAKGQAPALTLFIPFIRTPLNIVHYTMKRTPMALAYKAVRDELRHGTAEQRQATAGKIVMGSLLGALFTGLAASGLMTGSGDLDEDTKKLKMTGGWQPYSVKLGDDYYAYNRLGPMGILAGLAADIHDAATTGKVHNVEEAFGAFWKSAMNLTMNATYFRGVADLVKATSDPKRYASNFTENLAGAAVPNVVAKTVGFFDENVRDTEGIGEKLTSRLPGQSSKLPAKFDELGRPVKKDMGGLEQMFSPFNRRHDKHDPVINELVDLGIELKSRNTQTSMLGRDVDLPRELEAELGAIKGQALNLFLSRLVAAPGYQAIKSKEVRRKYVERAISDARGLGTKAFKAKYGRAVYGELVKQVRADRAQE